MKKRAMRKYTPYGLYCCEGYDRDGNYAAAVVSLGRAGTVMPMRRSADDIRPSKRSPVGWLQRFSNPRLKHVGL